MSISSASSAPALPFLVIGGACIVAGGLVSAVTGPLALSHGSWLAAYLVLVAGCAQIALGALQQRLAVSGPSPRVRGAQLGLFNVGNAAVIIGTLLAAPFVVDAGGLLLVAALAAFLIALRGSRPGVAVWVFRALVIVLLASIPIGLVLAHLRAG